MCSSDREGVCARSQLKTKPPIPRKQKRRRKRNPKLLFHLEINARIIVRIVVEVVILRVVSKYISRDTVYQKLTAISSAISQFGLFVLFKYYFSKENFGVWSSLFLSI